MIRSIRPIAPARRASPVLPAGLRTPRTHRRTDLRTKKPEGRKGRPTSLEEPPGAHRSPRHHVPVVRMRRRGSPVVRPRCRRDGVRRDDDRLDSTGCRLPRHDGAPVAWKRPSGGVLPALCTAEHVPCGRVRTVLGKPTPPRLPPEPADVPEAACLVGHGFDADAAAAVPAPLPPVWRAHRGRLLSGRTALGPLRRDALTRRGRRRHP